MINSLKNVGNWEVCTLLFVSIENSSEEKALYFRSVFFKRNMNKRWNKKLVGHDILCLILKVKCKLRLIELFFLGGGGGWGNIFFSGKYLPGNIVYSPVQQIEMNFYWWQFAFFTFGNYYVFTPQFNFFFFIIMFY